MADNTRGVTGQKRDRVDETNCNQAIPSSSKAASVISNECQDNKYRQGFSETIVLNDTNLTNFSILDEFGDSAVSDSSVDLQLRFQRLLAESALENSAVFNNVSLDKSDTQLGDFEDKYTSGTSTPCLNNSVSSNNVFGVQDTQNSQEFAALFKKYFSEDFIPAEKAADQLMADEIAWKKEFGLSPPVNEKLQLSCFSGIVGDAEISLRSEGVPDQKFKNKVSAEEYFSLKTDQMGSLNNLLSNKERPNFGTEIESPIISRARVAFVQDSIKDISEELGQTNESHHCDNFQTNIMSTIIGEEIDLNATPDEKSCSTLSVTSIEDLLSKHLQDTPGTIARSILNTKCRAKTQLSLDTSESTAHEQISSLSSGQGDDRNETGYADWIRIEPPLREFEAYVGSNIGIALHMQSQSTRWLKCYVTIQKIMHNNVIDASAEKEMMKYVKLPEVTLIGPSQKNIQMVSITPIITGKLEIYVNVIAEDAVTQTSKHYLTKFEISSKMPKVEILVNGLVQNEVDFGILPESCSQLINLEIRNYSDTYLPMTLDLEEVSNTPHTFFLQKNDAFGKSKNKSHSNSQDKKKSLTISVAFKAPCIKNHEDTHEGLIHFTAYLNIGIDFPGVKSSLLKKLKLKGHVGITQLLINFKSPVELSSSGPGISNSKTLTLKNVGYVPLHLKLMIIDPKSWEIESSGVIVVNNPTLHIQPGKEEIFTLVFTPPWVFQESIERRLLIHIAPDGNLFEINIHAKMTDGYRGKDKERLSYQSCDSTSTTSSSVRSQKIMPVQTTHKQLGWNTVPVGKSEMQSCRLRNDCNKPVKVHLTLTDNNGGFWLLNENGEHTLTRTIKLHAKECVPLNIIFSPSKIGVAYGKVVIKLTKRDLEDRFAIPLSGYGGTFNLSIRNVPKDKSGHMWINLGPLDNNLHTHFTLCNKGNLESFFYMKYVPKGFGVLLQGLDVSIQPSRTIIAPGSNETIRVSFSLQNDISFISKDDKDVLELGILYVTCGDEASRQRIRRIRDNPKTISTVHKALDLDGLCSPFPQETCIAELNALNDPESSLRSLYLSFQQHEITLTVERIDDRSMAMQTYMGSGPLSNESLIFKSILADNTVASSIQDYSGKDASVLWSITPCNLTLLVPRFASGFITIVSVYKDDQMYEVCSSENFLSVDPSSGIVPAMGETVVVVTCDSDAVKTTASVKSSLKVYLENDVKTVTVHIKRAVENLTEQKKIPALNSEIEHKSTVHSTKITKDESNKEKTMKQSQSTMKSQSVRIPKQNIVDTMQKSNFISEIPIVASNHNIIFPVTVIGNVNCQEIELTNTSTLPVQLQVSNSSPPFSVKNNMFVISGRGTAVIEVFFSPAEAHKFEQTLVVTCSSLNFEPCLFKLSAESIAK